LNIRGIALLSGLVLLAAISLLALGAASGTLLQRSMATNFEEDALALQNASISAGFALAWLNSRAAGERQADCVSDCLLPIGIRNAGEIPAQPEFEGMEWWRSNAHLTGYNPETTAIIATPDQGAEPARWIIEEIHYLETGDSHNVDAAKGLGYYRILSRGTGRNSHSVGVIEVIAARPWDGAFQAGTYPPDGPLRDFCLQFDSGHDCGTLSWRQRR